MMQKKYKLPHLHTQFSELSGVKFFLLSEYILSNTQFRAANN